MNPRHQEAAQKYRGRFAPSPTGPLHLGSLYTALAGFLQAKSRGGEWLLRIDDADTPRVTRGAADSIRRTLERFALHWDGPVAYQSHATDAYRTALERLDKARLLYPCVCSRKTLAALPRTASEPAIYPGTCRHAGHSRRFAHALRVAVGEAVIDLEDKSQGLRRWELGREFGDFIVFRRDQIFAYHLATVVDDAEAAVTEVLRGCDLLESTPLQIHLQNLLGLTTPDYLHIPVIVDRLGIKLSKQNLAEAVDEHNPSAILRLLLPLLGLPPPNELGDAPPAELLAWAVAHWDVSRLSGTAIAEPSWERFSTVTDAKSRA